MKRFFALLTIFTLVLSLFPNVSFAAVSEQELTDYLSYVSEERGMEVTKENLEDYVMEYYGEELAYFENLSDLKESLGPAIKANYSNLDTIYNDYGLDRSSLIVLLEENGETLDNYIFVEDLYFDVSFFLEPEVDFEIDEMFTELDLTEAEVEALFNHMLSLEEKLTDPVMEERLMELANRMIAFEDFESVDELTEEQINEFLAISQKLMNILELQPKFYLTNGKDTKSLSLRELLFLKEMNKGYKLLIKLYDLKGNLILDMKLTPEMIGATIIQETGKDIKEVPKVIDKIEKIKSAPKHKTVKGAKLPKTASDYGTNALAGLSFVLIGFFMFRRLYVQ
ncbi:processed acidic surface protein [Fictibacillus nanhaiensis]|uniref:processed acidic surface protein n=1 Tax=Fictibacillus nanhaiensis TaxID=742169 RepID=UPI001FE8DC56|nr:processed acidic surface protein [Fictibacillus nanhaiensis]